MRVWKERLGAFFFPTESDAWLAILRIGLSLQIILYVLSLRNDWHYLLAGGAEALASRDLSEKILSLESPLIPRLGWLVALGSRFGLPEATILTITWTCLLLAGLGLLIGLFSRFCAIVAWFIHLCAAKSGGVLSYGVDNFMTIGLFYLMLSPLPDQYSLDQRWRKLQPKNGQLLGFFQRLLQLHLSVVYFFGGLTKCLGSGWWDGSNIWRALIRPPSNIVAPELLLHWKAVLPIAGISICILETGYPFLIWHNRTQKIWLACICAMHVAIGITMGMYLFALIMIALNVAAFGPRLGAGQDEKIGFRRQVVS
jgi:uncharacterized membrane protein YphA (DoxX/SURF4 family)